MRPASLLRSILREPRTALPALFLLALGVGGFAWMMALHRSLMLRSLSAPRPDRLVSLWNGVTDEPEARGTPSTGELQLMRNFPEVFQGVAAWEPTNANLGLEPPVRVRLDRVTGNYFEVLGMRPALGRSFTPADDEAGAPPTVMLSHGIWRDRFGADPGLVGRTLTVNGVSAQVIGILPKGFHTPHGTELFRPFQWTAAQRDNHGPHYLRVLARLRDGASLSQARAAMRQVTEQIRVIGRAEKAPEDLISRLYYGATPLIDEALGQGLRVLRILQIATGLVLLLAAYNAAALLLARGMGRRNEMAVRSALGAQPTDLRRLLMVEGALLGLLGAAGGLLLAQMGLAPTGRILAWSYPDLALEGLSMDLPSVLTAALLGPLLGAGCALAAQPGQRLADILRMGGRNQNLAAGRSRRLLVGAQLVLGSALLLGALSLQSGLGQMLATDPGFDVNHVWCFQIQPGRRMPLETRTQLAKAIGERLSAFPGVEAVGAANGLPMSGFRSDLNTGLPNGRRIDPEARAMTPGMVRALGLRLLRGRDLEPTDGAGSDRVVLVTRKLAQEAFGTDDVVGRSLPLQDQSFRIVGVLGDVREFSPAQEAPPIFYLPLAQSEIVWNDDLYVAFRSTGPPPSESSLQALLREAAPGQALHRYRPMKDLLKTRLGPQRMARAFLGTFAVLALLLAGGGVFGLMAASVASRRAEFGVRSALGATPTSLLGQIMREAFWLATLAGLAGVFLGSAMERLSRSVLGTWPDPPILLAFLALGAMVGAALAAAFLPALRAASLDPARALRQD